MQSITFVILSLYEFVSFDIFLRLLAVFLRRNFFVSIDVDMFRDDFSDRFVIMDCVSIFVFSLNKLVPFNLFLRLLTVLLRSDFFTSRDVNMFRNDFLHFWSLLNWTIEIFIFYFHVCQLSLSVSIDMNFGFFNKLLQ